MQKATHIVGPQYGSCFSKSQMWARKHFDLTGATALLIRRWIVTAWLLLSSPFHPLTRPRPFTGTDWTCNRQQGALGQVTWQGVVRQTARHCNLLADEISISITVNAYSHSGVSGEASEHCNRRFRISACSLKKHLCVPGVFIFSPVLNHPVSSRVYFRYKMLRPSQQCFYKNLLPLRCSVNSVTCTLLFQGIYLLINNINYS